MDPTCGLLFIKNRRIHTWQGVSQVGQKKLFDRFLREKRVRTLQQSKDKSNIKCGNPETRTPNELEEDGNTEVVFGCDDEKLDLIVSSWKHNYFLYQQEKENQPPGKANRSSAARSTMEDESYLMAILEGDESTYDEDYEEDEDYDDETEFDDKTTFTIATHEVSEFGEFVRRHEQQLLARSFWERFMEVLGLDDYDGDIDDEDDEDIDIGSTSVAPQKSGLTQPPLVGTSGVTQKTVSTQRPSWARRKRNNNGMSKVSYATGSRDLACTYQIGNHRSRDINLKRLRRAARDEEDLLSSYGVETVAAMPHVNKKSSHRVRFSLPRTMTM
jgi:hypothetical protein